MDNDEPQDIRKRTFQYLLRAIKLSQVLQNGKDSAGWVIGKQFLRSATSIGANLEEAQAGETRADFIHKCGIAQKEIRDSLYWLPLLNEAKLVPEKRLKLLEMETQELYAVMTSILRSAKAGIKGNP